MFYKWILNVKSKEAILRRGTFWNLYSSILNSGMTALIIFFITLFGTNASIGYFSLATGIAYQCQAIGNFGMRNIQASDVKKEFTFFDFFNVRIFSSLLMYIALVCYAFQTDYSLEKTMIILTYGVYRSIDALEDLFHGEFQRNDRFDIGVILQSIRFTVSLAVLALVMLLFHNLVLSFICSIIVSLALFLIQNLKLISLFVKDKYHFHISHIKKIFLMCLPICICGFISMYIVNAPKYAIDNYLTNKIQTDYAILILPITIISILSTVIYRPQITYISKAWYNGETNVFKKILIKQIVIIAGLTISVILGGYIIGLSILGWIYGVNLDHYMTEFLLLLFGGGVYALNQLMGIVVTILRKQNYMFLAYIMVFIFILVSSRWLAVQYQMLGIVLIYVLSVSILAIILTMVCIFNYVKKIRR